MYTRTYVCTRTLHGYASNDVSLELNRRIV